ncbi:MAG TPA: helix-hairpin-helix domain-containing protein [Pyrinomonadaceae bacterium]|jgi:Pathogenicity locus.|nr:helix-hairpin-helix domain-containing protein [Pyrinomonadaceae bacterium]
MQVDERQLKDLISIGAATLEDLELIGIDSVAQLRLRNPQRIYQQLCRIKRQAIDPCCLDVFVAAVAQARDPNLPIEQCQWWYWSKVRKQQNKSD